MEFKYRRVLDAGRLRSAELSLSDVLCGRHGVTSGTRVMLSRNKMCDILAAARLHGMEFSLRMRRNAADKL